MCSKSAELLRHLLIAYVLDYRCIAQTVWNLLCSVFVSFLSLRMRRMCSNVFNAVKLSRHLDHSFPKIGKNML